MYICGKVALLPHRRALCIWIQWVWDSWEPCSLHYNQNVKAKPTSDVVVIGAGIIGVAIALEMRKRGTTVLVIDRGEPGKEASYAGAGMLAATDVTSPIPLRELAQASARMYPEFVAGIQTDASTKIDFRRDGALHIYDGNHPASGGTSLTAEQLYELEPGLTYSGAPVMFFKEDCVDPRTLMAAALQAAKHRGVEFISGEAVIDVLNDSSSQRVLGVRTMHNEYCAPVVVNCSGAWSAQIGNSSAPSRPVKGHLISLRPKTPAAIHHVIRSDAEDFYMLPRSNGLIVAGSTIENAGFDKSVNADTVRRLHQRAARLVPQLAEAGIQERWTGLRPGSPDDLPILGSTHLTGFFAAAGHYRNGILLAPVTASTIAAIIYGETMMFDLALFSPLRFGQTRSPQVADKQFH